MSLVYLVVVLKDGRRGWYVASDTRLDEFKHPIQVPLFDDEKSKQVTLDFALDARNRWRDYCRQQFGATLHISIEKYGEFIDEDRPAPSTGRDSRQPVKVTLDESTWYIVIPTRTPSDGECWCLRFDRPDLGAQSVFGPDPVTVLRRAQDRKILQFATAVPPDPAPVVPVPAQQQRPVPRLRPGDAARSAMETQNVRRI